MGPGLFFALALLAPFARAETAAGLDAQGVDPRVAVDNRWGLDVRDELGRPVSGEKVLADMKGAVVARAAQNAFVSRLPKARYVLPALELLAKAAAAFRLASGAFSIPELLPGLPGSRPRLSTLWLSFLAVAAMAMSRCGLARARLLPLRLRQSCPEVLRC
ncbi:MAG: hypothetical protein HYZ74_06430 [Elusimicrobia bacterium]|nr:hypothetical protein [Elusimicrobiota bacterium]